MGFELVNAKAVRIVLAVDSGDSINQVSKKSGVSYSYTHEWIERLEDSRIVERDESGGLHIQDHDFREAAETFAQTAYQAEPTLEDAYLLPNFGPGPYRFSKTDAVYIWTKGGYQIARNQHDYPLFIDVHDADLNDWQSYFKGYGIETTVGDRPEDADGIHIVLYPQPDEFRTDWVENAQVTPLLETVEWMQEFEANFQPALEMLDEMHDLGLDTTYREREVYTE